MYATLQYPTSSPPLSPLRTEAKTGWLVATREQDPRDSRFIKTTKIIHYHATLNTLSKFGRGDGDLVQRSWALSPLKGTC